MREGGRDEADTFPFFLFPLLIYLLYVPPFFLHPFVPLEHCPLRHERVRFASHIRLRGRRTLTNLLVSSRRVAPRHVGPAWPAGELIRALACRKDAGTRAHALRASARGHRCRPTHLQLQSHQNKHAHRRARPHARARTHARTHARTCTHARKHTLSLTSTRVCNVENKLTMIANGIQSS